MQNAWVLNQEILNFITPGVRASAEAQRCVLEQDTLSSA